MVNASRKAGLGNALIRAQKQGAQRRNPRVSQKHTVEANQAKDSTRIDLRSVTAQTNLDEFFEEVQLAGKQFVTEKRNVTLVDKNSSQNAEIEEKTKKINFEINLNVPRRPKWDSNTTPEELDEREKLVFLAWRKKLAELQENENVIMTPFEKNLEVWRQLWRVVERSDIIVQILDCRNPLLYLCEDLIKYVDEDFKGEKMNLVLLNKADFLTTQQRELWSQYFTGLGITTIFFSAKYGDDSVKHELIDGWRDLWKKHRSNSSTECSISKTRPLTVGLVGYPNVGKSSTINALLSAKRVAVSATPGKTKHFQTFFIDEDMMLCDCPGLVFPNFVSCKSEMVINGILPIDQMKDYVGPVRIIVDRIPRGYFEEIYGLAFEHDAKQNIIADDLLNALGFMRGFMTARGLPDISRAARKVCKDYIDGKILYCIPPPSIDNKLFQSYSKLADAMNRIGARGNDPNLALRITERQRRLMMQAKGTDLSARDFDEKYFNSKTGDAHIKGLPGIGNMTQPIGQNFEIKVSKRERKHKKKEKLRRVFRDLDI